MDMREAGNILTILEKTRDAVKKEDSAQLKELSNRTIHTASTAQDPDNILIAIIVYSLSKIIERKKYREYPGWNTFYKNYLYAIDATIMAIKKDDKERFAQSLRLIRSEIDNLSGDLKRDIQDVFRKASINKASKIYEHGISMEQTAKLLGITVWELASYAGQNAEVSETNLQLTQDVKTRIKLVNDIFKEENSK
jgi:hypothetical protein